MGVCIERNDGLPCQDACAEAQRIIRISDEVKITLDVIEKTENGQTAATDEEPADTAYLTTSKLAEKTGISSKDCNRKLCEQGLQEEKETMGKKHCTLAEKGSSGPLILQPQEMTL